MKSSGYRSIFHIYLIFFLSLFGALTAAVILSFLLFSLQKPDGSLVRSDWPRKFTEQFGEQIVLQMGSRCCSSREWNYCRRKESDSRSWMLRAVRFTASKGRNMLPASILHRICCFFSQKDRSRTDRGFVLPPHCPVIIAAFSIFP